MNFRAPVADAVCVRRVLLIVIAVLGLYTGIAFVVRSCASDETKIRRLIGSMEQAYDAGHPGACVAPLAKDWRHEGYELDRETLRGALLQASLERDKETHELTSRVEVDEDAATIRVDGEHATLACDATFARFRRGNWEETWRAHVEAELAKTDDGWKIVKSRHRDVSGTQLGR